MRACVRACVEKSVEPCVRASVEPANLNFLISFTRACRTRKNIDFLRLKCTQPVELFVQIIYQLSVGHERSTCRYLTYWNDSGKKLTNVDFNLNF